MTSNRMINIWNKRRFGLKKCYNSSVERFQLSIETEQMHLSLWLVFTCVWSTCKAQHNPLFFPNHSTIVQLFEWKFEAVARECEEFLGPNGFGAAVVSPVTENLILPGRPWYERYQPMSYLISSRSGNESELLSMTQRCNRAGVRIYVDVVLNHMAGYAERMIGTAGSTATFANRSYPSVPYVEKEFHRPCNIVHYRDAHIVRNCDLFQLPDLDQSLDSVRQRIAEFLNGLIELGVAGFRVGGCKHMWPNDLKVNFSKLWLKNKNIIMLS